MNKALIGVLAAGSIAGAAQAQTQLANTQADVKGRALSSFIVPMAGGNAQIGMSQQGNTNELSGALTLGDGDIRLRIAGDVSEEQLHALAAIGIKIKNGYAIIGGSYARELIAEFNKKLTGNSTFAQAVIANPIERVLWVYLKGDRKNANNTHLKTDVTHMQTVNVVDLLTVTDTATATTYRNTRRTTTTDIDTTTTADFIGGKKNTVTLGASLQATPDTKIDIAASHTRTRIPGMDTQKGTTGAIAITEYFPTTKTNITLGYATTGRVAAGVEAALDKNLTVKITGYTDTKGPNPQHGVYANVNYAFGGVAVDPGKMPIATGDQFTDALRRLDTRSPEAMRDVAGQGRVVVMSSTREDKRVDETTTENTVEKPKPPETPNTAPSAVSFAQATVLIAEKLVVWQTVWQLSCTDVAPTGAQNTCTYTGGNSNFAVSTGGSITLLNIGLTEWTYPVSVIATDAGWLTKTGTVSVKIENPCFGLTGEVLDSCLVSH